MKGIILIVILILAVSCDPPFILIVENQTNDSILFKVNTREPIRFDSIYASDSLIADELIKLNTIPQYFNNTIDIVLIDSMNYKFTLKPKREILISPSTIGLPFKSVTYELGGKNYEIMGQSGNLNDNIEITQKPLRTTIVKINN